MPKYATNDRKVSEAFQKSAEAREQLRTLARLDAEAEPALAPLKRAASTLLDRTLSLSGMPEGDIDRIEREADAAAGELQAGLNALQEQKPELYRQHCAALEETWKGLGLPLQEARQQAPQAPAQQPPQPQAQQKKEDLFSVDGKVFAVFMTQSMKRKGPAPGSLDRLIDRLEKSSDKEAVQTLLYNAKNLKERCADAAKYIGTPQEEQGDHNKGNIALTYMRREMKKLQKERPELYVQLCEPFVQEMSQNDYSEARTHFAELESRKEKEWQEERAQQKQDDKQTLSEKVTLYGNVEVSKNSGFYLMDKVRNEILEDPGFQKDPPVVDPKKLAILNTMAANVLDSGFDKPQPPDFAERALIMVDMKSMGAYYKRLAGDPEVHRILREREEGKTWCESSNNKLMDYLQTIEKKYARTRESGPVLKKSVQASAEAKSLLEDYSSALENAGNKHIGPFYLAMERVERRKGVASADLIIDTLEKGADFIDSVTGPGKDAKTKGAKECLMAAMLGMKAMAPPEEFAALCDRVNQRRGVEDPAHADYLHPAMFEPGDLQNGLEQIDAWKAGIKKNEDVPEAAAKIMAARLLTNTPGGKAAYLDTPVSSHRVNELSQALLKNEHFKAWTATLNKDKAAELLSGHGGSLEKGFRNYLRTLPAGKLDNSPELARWMPTVKERIEALQDQTKDPARRTAAAAEIIALRSIGHAVRSKKSSLEHPIPATGTLKADTETLAQEPALADILQNDRKARSLLRDGHGGALVNRIREAYWNQDRSDGVPSMDIDAELLLDGNNLGGRMEILKNEAREMMGKLKKAAEEKAAPREQAKLMKNAKRLAAEYDVLCMQAGQGGSFEKGMEKDMPWNVTEPQIEKMMSSKRFAGQFTGLEAAAAQMHAIESKKPEQYVLDKAAEVAAAEKKSREAEVQPVKEQPVYGQPEKEEPLIV